MQKRKKIWTVDCLGSIVKSTRVKYQKMQLTIRVMPNLIKLRNRNLNWNRTRITAVMNSPLAPRRPLREKDHLQQKGLIPKDLEKGHQAQEL
ncbi:UNVERIFIED_CONTAM: hypothetical protein FKN15_026038 [Acipenser sinensis]